MRVTTNSSNSSTNSQPTSLCDKFITLVASYPEDSPKLDNAISFLTQPSFLTNIPSEKYINTIARMIEKYPERGSITKKLVEKLVIFPVFHRIVTAVKSVNRKFFECFDEDVKLKVCQKFEFSSFLEISKLAADCSPWHSLPKINFDPSDKFVSISDVFNESSSEVLDNSSKALQCVDQFQPFTERDVSDFVINLVSNKSPISKKIAKKYQDRNTLLSLLRPFKNTKITIDDLITAFDSNSITIQSPEAFSVFISAIKEVTNSRVVPAAPFLKKWKQSKTQLDFIQHIIKSNPTPVQFPKPAYQKINNILVAEFKGDYWKNLEFVKALASLYDELPDEINTLLSEMSPTNSTALLLIVLAQSGESSAFAGQLLGNLVNCPTQYMPGISALWAINKDFLIKTTIMLHSNKPSMLGRCYDIADDLGALDEFMEKSTTEFKTILEIFGFFRCGNDFRKHLKELKNYDLVIQIFEKPKDFGFLVPMSFERKLKGAADSDSNVSADFLFFSFMNEIYLSLDASIKNKTIPFLFQKCSERSKKLLQHEFFWHKKISTPAAKASRDLDLPAMAMKTEKKETDKFRSIVQSLVFDFPKDKQTAEKNGQSVGILLSRNLLCCDDSVAAMNLITRGLSLRESTPGFAFSREAVRAMAPGFELCLPFARQIVTNQGIKRLMPEVHKAAVLACMPHVFKLPYETPVQPTSFDINSRLKRFKYVHPEQETQRFNQAKSMKWDNYALGTIINEYKALTGAQINDYHFQQVCVEAAIYTVYDLIMNYADRTNVHMKLARIAKWLSIYTIEKCNPSFGRFFNIPDLIVHAYENNMLSIVVPFLGVLFSRVPEVFYIPCPWSVSILSALGAVYRLPFLKKSICETISSIFKAFNCEVHDVHPKRLRPLDHIPVTDSDFLFPPINFEVSTVSREGLYSGDIASIVAVVSRFYKGADNQTTKEVALFVYSKVPAIAKSAYETAFSLSTNDFSHSKDSNAAETYAKSLIRTLCKALASAAVQLEFTYIDARSTRFIESLVTMISHQVAVNLLLNSMKPIRRLRETPEGPFLDIQAFPPSVAAVVPEALWPHSSEKTDNAEGIFGCYSVTSQMKKVYSRFEALKLDTPIQSDIPYDRAFAQHIFNSFIYNQAGEAVDFKQIQIQITNDILSYIATVIYCFPPQRSTRVMDLGTHILRQINLSNGGDLYNYAPEVERFLMRRMPHMLIFTTLITLKLVRVERIEYILMSFFDEYGTEGIDLSPIIEWLYTVVVNNRERKAQCFQRLFELLSTTTTQNSKHLNDLRNTFFMEQITEPQGTCIEPKATTKMEQLVKRFKLIHKDETKLKSFVNENKELLNPDDTFYELLITTCYPNNRQELLQILFAAMHFNQETNAEILKCFLREVFNAFSRKEIDGQFFSSVVGTSVVHLRYISINIAMAFGGFLNDTMPNKYQNFTSIWLYLFPLIIPPLLDDDRLWEPSSLLASGLYKPLDIFPADWSKHECYRKFYKGILRTTLLLIHDSPRFMSIYATDFIKDIPLHFRRLRNIILSTNAIYDTRTAHRSNVFSEICKGTLTFQSYIAVHEQKSITDFNNIFADVLSYKQEKSIWIFARGLLLAVDNAEDATTVVESLFDFLRCNSEQTRCFENVIVRLFNELDKTYNQMSIKDIIKTVFNARIDNIPPLPYGLKSIAPKINK